MWLRRLGRKDLTRPYRAPTPGRRQAQEVGSPRSARRDKCEEMLQLIRKGVAIKGPSRKLEAARRKARVVQNRSRSPMSQTSLHVTTGGNTLRARIPYTKTPELVISRIPSHLLPYVASSVKAGDPHVASHSLARVLRSVRSLLPVADATFAGVDGMDSVSARKKANRWC